MVLSYLENISWEPATVTFVFVGLTPSKMERFVKEADQWLRSGKNRLSCKCKYRMAEFRKDLASLRVELNCEWLCRSCVRLLAGHLSVVFPDLTKVEVGFPYQATGREPAFIRVPVKDVEFEDGSRASVAEFDIARFPVTTSEFESFIRNTGYVTTAEERLDSENFRKNSTIVGLSRTAALASPVCCVSFRDAIAFCSFGGTRLPTEAEWLAAAVSETVELEIDPVQELKLRRRPLGPRSIVCDRWEITSTEFDTQRVVARRGPLTFLKKNWKSPEEYAFHRREISSDECDIMITFRVAKSLSS